MGRSRLFSMVLVGALASPAAIAGTSFGHPTGTGGIVSRPALGSELVWMGGGLHVKARSVTWVALDGHTLVQRPATGLDLDALVAPAGAWTDVEIEVQGGLTLSGEDWTVKLGGGTPSFTPSFTLAVTLSEPVQSLGATALNLSVELPAWITDAVRAAPGGSLVVGPSHPLYSAVWTAVQDGASAE